MSNHRNFTTIGLASEKRARICFVAAERRGDLVTHHRITADFVTEAIAILEAEGLAAPGWFDEVHGTWARHNAVAA